MKGYSWFLGLGLSVALLIGLMGHWPLGNLGTRAGFLAMAQAGVTQEVTQADEGLENPLPEPPAVPETSPRAETDDGSLSTEPAEFRLEALPILADVETTSLSLSENLYEEPGQFQVGVLEGYRTSINAGVVVIESPTGELAYTVQVQQRANPRPLGDEELVQIAIDRLERGEGFRLGRVRVIDTGVVIVDWTGTLGAIELSGRVFLRQVASEVLMLVVSATEENAAQLDPVLSLLSNTLQLDG
ncbi:MAG: hypothetical protein R6U67_02695 [Sodalinema sp.]|uniref:hypothetical protein n=1 Tax=Sodalinema sp. TaxID=3080550 RepID=UPI00120D2AD9|nr:MAG: hypothetical protein EYR95_07250 [Phormidium sp. SL48-SHIP]